jgi:hypothetical protein
MPTESLGVAVVGRVESCGSQWSRSPTFNEESSMRSSQVRLALFAIVLVASLGLVGCSGGGKEFTPEQFKTVTKDMPEAKVIEILGTPRETSPLGDERISFWESKGNYYGVSFAKGKVVAPTMYKDQSEYAVVKGMAKALGAMKK